MKDHLAALIFTAAFSILNPLWIAFDRCARFLPLRRYQRRRGNRVETAVVTLKSPEGKELILAGTRHVGALKYYQEIGSLIGRHPEHLILLEGIRPKKNSPEPLKKIFDFARTLSELTDSQYQGGVRFRFDDSFTVRFPDTTQARLERMFRRHRINHQSIVPSWIIFLLSNESVPFRLKRDFAHAFITRNDSLTVFGALGRLFSPKARTCRAILTDYRDRIAVRNIWQAMKHEDRDVISLWGCNHLPGIIDQLLDKGCMIVGTEWLTVMTIRPQKE